jgi:hypothetical protein
VLREQLFSVPLSVSGKKFIALAFTFSFRKNLIPNLGSSSVNRCIDRQWGGGGVNLALFFFLLAVAENAQLLFVYRQRRVSFLDNFFKGFSFPRTFRMEKEKNSGREHTNKILNKNIFKK